MELNRYNGRLTISTLKRDPRVYDDCAWGFNSEGFLVILKEGVIQTMVNIDQIERIDFSPPRS